MKSKRQAQLLKIVEKREVETQEELMHYLREYGIKVTQATISRDIKELRLAKVPNGRG
ncbi:MAG TPA: arginine repressor, partial [Firmicutes bacterium]|nr:arginine repressor [Bacillota bacterium]